MEGWLDAQMIKYGRMVGCLDDQMIIGSIGLVVNVEIVDCVDWE